MSNLNLNFESAIYFAIDKPLGEKFSAHNMLLRYKWGCDTDAYIRFCCRVATQGMLVEPYDVPMPDGIVGAYIIDQWGR